LDEDRPIARPLLKQDDAGQHRKHVKCVAITFPELFCCVT